MSARSIRRSHQRRARRAAVAAGTAIGGSALLASGAQAASFNVVNNNDAGAGSLRAAILSANGSGGPDVVNFSAGVTGEIRLTIGEIPITDAVTINGPGAGVLALSGDANNNNLRTFATGNAALGDSRIFRITDATSPGTPLQDVTISGLTMREGVSDFFSGGLPQSESGGAIYAQQTNLTLNNTTFSDNASTEFGGAVYLTAEGPVGDERGALTVNNSLFNNNRALQEGGAITSQPTKYSGPSGDADGTTITSSQITGNRAGGNDFGVFGSTTAPEGGGLDLKYESDLSGVTISGNAASGSDGSAGGAYIIGGTISNSVVTGNTANRGGGLMLRGTKVESSTVSGNSAVALGGGLVAGSKYGSPARLDDSTVSGNTATGTGTYEGAAGGVAVYVFGTDATLVTRNSTVAANTAAVQGGGIMAFGYTEADEPSVRLRSSIVADNAAAGTAPDLAGMRTTMSGPVPTTGAFSAGFSLVENPGAVGLIPDPDGTNVLGVDPQLGPLADNGGPTQTQAIAPTSAAIDAAQANGLATDQRGQPRTVDALATDNAISDGTDMGAFELADASATGDDPETEFKKKPKKKLKLKDGKKTAKVKLKFRGIDNAPPLGPMRFECKVDKGAFDECASPLKLKLGRGKHKIEVRAIDADGNIDSTPAKAKIKVK